MQLGVPLSTVHQTFCKSLFLFPYKFQKLDDFKEVNNKKQPEFVILCSYHPDRYTDNLVILRFSDGDMFRINCVVYKRNVRRLGKQRSMEYSLTVQTTSDGIVQYPISIEHITGPSFYEYGNVTKESCEA